MTMIFKSSLHLTLELCLQIGVIFFQTDNYSEYSSFSTPLEAAIADEWALVNVNFPVTTSSLDMSTSNAIPDSVNSFQREARALQR